MFCHIAKRKLCMCKLLLCQSIQYIALILIRVKCFFQKVSARGNIFFYMGIMSCYHIVISEFPCPTIQLIKFQITITVNTRIRRHPIFIGSNKTFNYIFFKTFRKIEHIIWNSKFISYISCILHIIQRTTGTCLRNTDILIMK